MTNKYTKKHNIQLVPNKQINKAKKIYNLVTLRDVKRILYDTEYLAGLSINIKERLVDKWKEFKIMPCTPFNKEGVTKKEALDMCKAHDILVKGKKKHPLTLDQVKQNEENTAKQQKAKLVKPTEKTALNDEKLL